MSFSTLSPEQRRLQLQPVDAFPVSGAVWDVTMRVLLATACHHSAKVDVTAIPSPGNALQNSVAPFWATLTSKLQPLDRAAPQAHAASYFWPTYQEAMDKVIQWAAPATSVQQQ